MDLRYSAEYESFRDEVRRFVEEHWPPRGEESSLPLGEQAARFRARAIERGYLARSVPRRFGGAGQPPDVLKAQIVRDELRRKWAPGDPIGIGFSMLVPTLLEHGAEWQKERFVGPTVRGEMSWCQGYSEPGAGSDLASVRTRGELRDGEWVINGQKIWTSGAQTADYMFLLARTEPEAPKHAGISYLLLDMKQPGIDVRPLRQMTGTADFNEVFFNDVRTPEDHIVGRRGEGWIVSRSTLKHERNMLGSAEGVEVLFEGLVKLARQSKRDGRPAIQDSAVRQGLAEIEGYVAAHRFSSVRQLTLASRGQGPGIAGLMNKLHGTNIERRMVALALDLLGQDGLLAPSASGYLPGGPNAGGWIRHSMWSLGMAIGGGTANIQRNIIGERGLGLPRDRAAQRSK